MEMVPAVWHACFEALPHAVLLLNADDTVVDANPAARRLLELPAQHARWTDLWRRLREQDGVGAAVQATRGTAQAQPAVVVTLPWHDGSRRCFQLELAPLPGSDHTGDAPAVPPHCVLCVVQDVTTRNATMAAMRASEARYHQLLEHAFDGIYTLDLTGRFTSVNRAWQAKMGYSQEEALEMTIDQIVDPQHLEAARRSLARKLEGTARRRIELDCRCKDGGIVTAEVSSSILYEDGRPVGLIGIARDVTERQRMEAALRASEERLRAVVSNAPVVLFALDAAGTITLAEGRGLEALGLAGAGAVGHSVFRLYQAREDLLDDARRALAGAEVRVTREIAGVVLEMRYVPTCDADGKVTGAIGVATDVTERIRAEEALRRQAQHDALTGLPNRALLYDRLERSLSSDAPVSLLLLDLDRFKEVNDTLGHDAGDCLLRAVGARLCDALYRSDTVARLGGDEFAILLPTTGLVGATRAVEKILAALTHPFAVAGWSLDVAVSIGIASYPEHGTDPATLLRHADVAMYVAKRGGLGSSIYDAAHDHHTLLRFGMERARRTASGTA